MRILSLDWDASYQRDLAVELEAAGHQVDLLARASEGLAHDAQRPYDLVIAESRLPDRSGLQFLRELRQARGGTLPPLVFLTDADEPRVRELCLQEGAARFLAKRDGWPAVLAEVHGVITEVEPVPAAPASSRRAGRDARVFRGNLETIEILDIIQLLHLGRKTGVLVLSGDVLDGRIYFREGEVVSASGNDLQGERAFADLLGLKRGPFRFEAGPVDVEPTVHQPTALLLLDTVRVLDEDGRRSYEGNPAAAGREGDAFDFEHQPVDSGHADEDAEEVESVEGWRLAGLREGEEPEEEVEPAVPDPAASAPVVPERFSLDEPLEPPAGRRGSFAPPASLPAREERASAAPATPAAELPGFAGRDAGPASAPTDVRPAVPPPTRSAGIRARMPMPSRRMATVAGAAIVVLLASGYALFSGLIRSPTEGAAEEDYRSLMQEATENQAKIDSLEQLIRDLSSSIVSGAVTGDAAAQKISLIQSEIERASAERDAAQQTVEKRLAEERKREEARRAAQKQEEEKKRAAELGAQVAEAGRRDSTAPTAQAPGAGQPSLAVDARVAPTNGDAAAPASAAGGDQAETAGGSEPQDRGAPPAAADTQALRASATAGAAANPAPAPAGPAENEGPDLSLDALRAGPQFVPVDTRPMPRGRIQPAYPKALADRKLGGTVTLWVLVNGVGGVEDVRVLRSSGHVELDRSAMDAIGRAAYRPARRANESVATWTQQQVTFKLDKPVRGVTPSAP